METIGAKIRNRLSPYKNLIQMANDERFSDDVILKILRGEIHAQCLKELILLSEECEIESKYSDDYFLYLYRRKKSEDEFKQKLCYCGYTNKCDCGDPGVSEFNQAIENKTLRYE